MGGSRFGLRPRLAAWIAAIVVVAVGGSFIAIYRGTSTDLRSRIDSDLSAKTEEFMRSLPAGVTGSKALASASQKFINRQRFEAVPRIYLVQISGGPTVTNEAEVLGREQEKEREDGGKREQGEGGKASDEGDSSDGGDTSTGEGEEDSQERHLENGAGRDESGDGESQTEPEGSDGGGNEDGEDSGGEGFLLGPATAHAKAGSPGILNAPPGFTDVTIEEAGLIRILSQPIERGGRALATFRVGQPLQSVERAESGLLRTFLFVGVAALLAAIALAYIVATRTSRPLRRMARTAASVSGGELSHRIEYDGPQDEVGVLAGAFNRMLDRIERAFRRERSFLSDVSHELRTPLTVVRGQLEVLVRRGETPRKEVERTTEIVIREVDRMDRLVDDLTLLARAEEGSLLERSDVDCDVFLRELLDSLTLLGERRWELSEPPAGTLNCDPDRVAQVVRNLARNAVEHSNPGDKVGVSVTASDSEVTVAVSDEGPGIESSQLGRIFDRFYRTDKARSRRSGGTGLGLAIAKALVEAHGGHIKAESVVGEGTTVTFVLPGYKGS